MRILDKAHEQLSKFNRKIETIITRFHRSYFVFACLFAIFGYFLILLPALMIIIAAANIYEAFSTGGLGNWQQGLIWTTVFMIAVLLTYRISRIKVAPPAGLVVSREKLPEIFKLVEQAVAHFKRPEIERIIITGNYELDVIKVPRFPVPVWSMNTLVIGLPVLLCHAPKQFECMVTRRIGQFSKKSNPISNWVYQLRAIWKQYLLAYDTQKTPDSLLLKWIFGAYAYLYTLVSTYPARRDELNADTYAMEIFTHEDVRKMITADVTYQWFLEERYWPAINKKVASNPGLALTPYKNINATIKANFTDKKLMLVVEKVFKERLHINNPNAPMLQRLENVGHDTPSMSAINNNTAAVKYLGDSLVNVIGLIDKLWLNNNLKTIKHTKK